jgi:hypothetical protein
LAAGISGAGATLTAVPLAVGAVLSQLHLLLSARGVAAECVPLVPLLTGAVVVSVGAGVAVAALSTGAVALPIAALTLVCILETADLVSSSTPRVSASSA